MLGIQAAKVYNEHVAKNGSPPSHAQATQIMYVALIEECKEM
jgi:hypothetical protein